MIPRAVRAALAMAGLLAVIGACAPPAARPVFPELTYGHLAPIELDVARIEIVDEYEPPLKLPNIEHEFPTPPAVAAKRWMKDRLRAVGGSGSVRAILRQASVVEVALKKGKGVRAALTTEQSERYDAKLSVEIEVRSERGFKDAYVSATVSRTRTVPEDITLNEREKVFFEITEGLMGDLNAQLEKQIKQHLQRYLR